MPSVWSTTVALVLAGVWPVGTGLTQPPQVSSPYDLPTTFSDPAVSAVVPVETGPATDGPCEYILVCSPARPRWAPDMIQLLSGAYVTTSLGPGVPDFNYVPFTGRLGWYLNPPRSPGALVFLVDYTTAVVTSGFGNYFTGPSLLLRYERWPDGPLVPYFQVGAGVVLNDAYKKPFQRAIGQQSEFYLHAGLGVRYRINESWSLDLETELQHISNASLADRNAGINNIGLAAGLTYSFGGR